MRLAEYLEQNKISDAAFGRSIQVSREAVRRYRMLERFPDTSILERIYTETQGAVTPNDFFSAPDVKGAA